MGKKTVVLPADFSLILEPVQGTWAFRRVALYTDFGLFFPELYHHIFVSELSEIKSFPSKMNQRRRFQGVFQHPEAQPIYPDYIGPNIRTSRSGIVLGGWRAVIVYFRYYRDILVSIMALTGGPR